MLLNFNSHDRRVFSASVLRVIGQSRCPNTSQYHSLHYELQRYIRIHLKTQSNYVRNADMEDRVRYCYLYCLSNSPANLGHVGIFTVKLVSV